MVASILFVDCVGVLPPPPHRPSFPRPSLPSPQHRQQLLFFPNTLSLGQIVNFVFDVAVRFGGTADGRRRERETLWTSSSWVLLPQLAAAAFALVLLFTDDDDDDY